MPDGINIQGVDLATGKLLLPVKLASLSGPNGFGEDIGIQYSTLGLMTDIKTYNQDSPTGILGLGWSLTIPFITRIGNGSLTDKFFLNGVLLKLKTPLPSPYDPITEPLDFETTVHSLVKILYFKANEYWQVTDADGVIYRYGGAAYANNAIEWGVHWRAKDGQVVGQQPPVLWIGPSVATDNQEKYPIVWNIAYKQNTYGQRVDYYYATIEQGIGHGVKGQREVDPLKGDSVSTDIFYTVAAYLRKVAVNNGDYVELNYEKKYPWEYPTYPRTREINGTLHAAYQDRIKTRYLQGINIYNAYQQAQATVCLDYGCLWNNIELREANNIYRQAMNKRILTAMSVFTPQGLYRVPRQEFDYWGYGGDNASNNNNNNNNNDGFAAYFNSEQFSILKISNDEIAGVFPTSPTSHSHIRPFEDVQGNVYYQLFGHLKNSKASTGALTWYSYQEVAQNYESVRQHLSKPVNPSWSDFFHAFNEKWDNQLDLKNITRPGTESERDHWKDPTPYWGQDGYVVIRWINRESIGPGGKQTVHLSLYEWVGYWREITIKVGNTDNNFQDPPIAHDEDENPGSTLIATGPGVFALVRSGIQDPNGPITLFRRHRYIPGRWEATSFEESTEIKSDAFIPVVNISHKIVTVLDKQGGVFYGYGWNGENWNPSGQQKLGITFDKPGQKGALCSAASDADAFFLYVNFEKNRTFGDKDLPAAQYFLYHYESTGEHAWTYLSKPLLFSKIFCDTFFIDDNNKIVSLDLSTLWGNGFLVVQGIGSYLLSNVPVPNQTFFYYMPLIVSWDEYKQVSFQKIISSNATKDFLGFTAVLSEEQYGFNIGDNIYFPTMDKKYAYTFTGSSRDNQLGYNRGWVDRISKNSPYFKNSNTKNFLVNFPLDNGTITADFFFQNTFIFYQYDPFTQEWRPLPGFGSDLGKQWNVENILLVINLVLTLLSVALIALGPAAGIFPIITRVLLAAEWMLPLTRILAGGAVAELVSGSTIASALLSGANFLGGQLECMAQGYILEKLLRGLYHGYSDNSLLGDYTIFGQQYADLSFYHKKWDNNEKGYNWKKDDRFDLRIDTPVKNPKQIDPNSPKGLTLYPGDITKVKTEDLGVSSSSLLLGNHFIAYDYTASIHYGGMPGFSSETYFLSTGQVAFVRNGQVSKLVRMPLLDIPKHGIYVDSKFSVYTYDGVASKQIAYQLGTSASPDGAKEINYGQPLLSAPWGGILGFLSDYNNGMFDTIYHQKSLQYAFNLGLFMARDERLEGKLRDYIVNKVSINDGYQTTNTHFQFMPQQAVFDNNKGVMQYNQVRVAYGIDNYVTAAKMNGWNEYYFYSGADYHNMPYHLPHLPQHDDAIAEKVIENNEQYLNLLLGKSYYQRTFRVEEDNQDTVVASQRTLYYVYTVTEQAGTKKRGVVPIRRINKIDDALVSQTDYSYDLHDMPWPSGQNPIFDTALLTWQQSNSWNAANTPDITEIRYHYGFEYYPRLRDLNLYNPIVETKTKQYVEKGTPYYQFKIQTWDCWDEQNQRWTGESISSSGVYWSPRTVYFWRGVDKPSKFPWGSPPEKAQDKAIPPATASSSRKGTSTSFRQPESLKDVIKPLKLKEQQRKLAATPKKAAVPPATVSVVTPPSTATSGPATASSSGKVTSTSFIRPLPELPKGVKPLKSKEQRQPAVAQPKKAAVPPPTTVPVTPLSTMSGAVAHELSKTQQQGVLPEKPPEKAQNQAIPPATASSSGKGTSTSSIIRQLEQPKEVPKEQRELAAAQPKKAAVPPTTTVPVVTPPSTTMSGPVAIKPLKLKEQQSEATAQPKTVISATLPVVVAPLSTVGRLPSSAFSFIVGAGATTSSGKKEVPEEKKQPSKEAKK